MASDVLSPVVTVDWLAQHLDDPTVAIVDCRFSLADLSLGRSQCEDGHIPGAIYADLNQNLSRPVQRYGGRHPLPNVNTLAVWLGTMGITSEGSEPTTVVAYDASRFAFAARFWWLLRYLGHDRVKVLDGGYGAWVAAGHPVSSDRPQRSPSLFMPRSRTDWVVNFEVVRDRPATAVLIDSREADRYRGEREPIDPMAGHIPGALNYPWSEVTHADGTLRSLQEQQQRWQAIADRDEIMVYCGSGVTACVNILSLEISGLSSKLYPGSWSDWCTHVGEPGVAIAPEPKNDAVNDAV